MSIKQDIELNITRNEPLAQYTTYKIGGPAKYFIIVKSEEELIEAVRWAKENNEKYFVLGGGSNVLVSDDGFDGLIIKMENSKFEIIGNKIIAQAGAILSRIVLSSIEKELTGLEFAMGIPGTIGGAVRGNAGAFGGEVGQVVDKVKVFDGEKIKEYFKKDLKFSYRESVFKEPGNKEIILEVEIKLKKGDPEKSKGMIKEYLAKRSKHPLDLPSAGSTFKNVELKKGKLELLDPAQGEIKETLKNDITQEYIDLGKIPAGFLIEYVDLKGKRIGNVQISPKHANYIVNLGGGRAEDVIMLISHIKQKVRSELGIQLREEIQYVGF